MKENAVPKGTKDATKSSLTLFESVILKFCIHWVERSSEIDMVL